VPCALKIWNETSSSQSPLLKIKSTTLPFGNANVGCHLALSFNSIVPPAIPSKVTVILALFQPSPYASCILIFQLHGVPKTVIGPNDFGSEVLPLKACS
jgi:hypothetical protein